MMVAAVLCVSFAGCSQQTVGKTAQATEAVKKIQTQVAGPAEGVMLDDLEGAVTKGLDGTFDYGAGNGASIEVVAATDIKQTGEQSIKVTFDSPAESYMYIARGFGLDAANTQWLMKPEDIAWDQYRGLAFYMYGTNSGTQVAFDVKDASGELWRFMTADSFAGWKQIVADFSAFMVRDDWQPDSAEKNGTLDFPLKSFQFEPRPVSKGTLYFDTVELIKK
jgi:uncharacterized cupredoxin-like copper-binding protein